MFQLSTYSGFSLGLKSETLCPFCTASGNDGFGKLGSMLIGARVGSEGSLKLTLPAGPKFAGKLVGSTLVERLRPWLALQTPFRKPMPCREVEMLKPPRSTASPPPASQCITPPFGRR